MPCSCPCSCVLQQGVYLGLVCRNKTAYAGRVRDEGPEEMPVIRQLEVGLDWHFLRLLIRSLHPKYGFEFVVGSCYCSRFCGFYGLGITAILKVAPPTRIELHVGSLRAHRELRHFSSRPQNPTAQQIFTIHSNLSPGDPQA